ncbi:amino acid adenylation domain-containing protein [Streptomyces sp. NPDC001852]|uniref:hybrid non-ribosomal peptide synthetase/type I polyketide synthase n=1 Tax=Streptomyces sp. NPDC001852 TaxID=3364619 RepID=UPI00367B7C3B
MSAPISDPSFTDAVPDSSDIAVVGMACRFPGASDPEAFWRNLRDGVVSIERLDEAEVLAEGVPRELLERPEYVRAAPVLDDIDLFDAPFFGFTGREAALLDPQQRLFLECAWQALEGAGFDPARAGRAGVYAGAGMSAYLMSNLLGGGRLLMSASGFELQIHNDKDYLSTRTAYKLGLTGPAVTVQTACSSSLVAVHQACQALQGYECELALAGAACVRVPHRVGYLYEAGLMFSPDGFCRPFDADAAGTVFGSGVGVVALRRLADAVADGDTVLAVIKATATNNDGSAKVGFTAPGVDGQAEVVTTALELAEIDARTVTALEAHGTGTPLGDPIEVTALTRAFRAHTEDTGYCALSSVKGNVGHLEAAAGMASLIKAVLQLRHRQLAPTANFRTPNPQLGIEKTPFRITGKLTDWTATDPLRIGVSSFGIGGTNAHLVLEEAPEPSRSVPPGRERQLITVSARTPQALDDAAGRLAAHFAGLDAAPSGPGRFADAAYTLQAGRHPFRFRRTVVAASGAEAAGLLSGEHPELVTTADAGNAPSEIVFLFPGQGAQYAGMSRGLYDSEPGFRTRLDACAELLRPHLGADLREVLYSDDSGQAAAARITATGFAQPALFSVEYALAGLLGDFGVQPSAMVGHSVGELVAACLADVLELPDALRLVALRGRMMQEQPAGAMLSVAAPEERVRALLPPGADIAAVNAPALCVASGPEEAIARLESDLAGEDIGHRRLHTSHAFHSAMMDPIVAPFTEEVRRTRLSPPRRPFVSDVTGTWISGEQATDPSYWGSHARKPVRFADAVATASTARAAFVEVGPGNTLASLTRQAVRPEARAVVVTTLPRPDESRSDTDALLEGLGGLWQCGLDLDWETLHAGARRRVPLPTYPFQRQRYWVEPRDTGTAADLDVIAPAEPAGTEADTATRPEVLTAHAPARNEDERAALALWEECFGFTGLGIHDNFFELGGHSLLATRMLVRYRELTGRTLTLSELLAAPTVAGMVTAARKADAGAATLQVVPDPGHRFDPFPLTEMQQAQWIGRLGSFDLGGVAAHVYLEFDSRGLDLARAERAWQNVVDRHDMLRVVVLPDGRQRIVETVTPYRFPTLDLRDADAAAIEDELAVVRSAMEAEVRPADTWPLWEIRATRLPDDRIRLHISFDLIVADVAGFFFQLLPEWGACYDDPGRQPDPLELTFRDYVLAEQQMRRTPDYERALEYWRRRVAELPPAPELPVRSAGRTADESRFTRRHASVPPEVWQRIRAQATAHGITASTALIAAYAAVIGAWSKSQHFTLNLTAVDRLPVHPQIRDIVGEFASFELLEVDLRGVTDFADLARQIQRRSWKDFEHRHVSGVRVLRELARERGNNATMPVVVTSSLTESEDRADDTFGWLGEQSYFISQTPQVTLDHFIMEVNGTLELAWHALEEHFPEGMLDDMFGAYHALVAGLADSEGWAAAPCPGLPSHQREARARANRTDGPAPRGLLTDSLLRTLADPALAESPAVIAPDRTLTHSELVTRACALAQELHSRGHGRAAVIGVRLPKGWRQIVAAVAASLAGALYVPIDPDLPEARQRWLVTHAGVDCLLTGDDDPLDLDVEAVPVRDAVVPAQEAANWRCPAQPEDVAYVIYTSGSTGTPKGVAVTHLAALNTISDINERFRVGPGDAVLGLSSLSFDLSVHDVFGVIAAGGTLVLPEPEARRDPARWLELVRTRRVTLWNTVPALMQMLVEHAEAVGATGLPLRVALLSGDWIPVTLPDRIRGVAAAEVISLGGATEAAIWSIAHPVDEVGADWSSIPYGRPLRNQRFHVLNERMEPTPVWVPGQLHIAGAGLAEGYWNDPERTAESFFPHPTTGERLYRTGDLGRYLPDGTIEFLGREDFQVKVGGFRIELGEIEHALDEVPGLRWNTVAAIGPRHQQRLVAYLVPEPEAVGDLVELARRRLTEALPSYMCPSDFVLLDTLPLSSNGKVDRAALPEPERHGGRRDVPEETDAAVQETAARLAAVAAELLGLERVGAGDNFFELGGDSILGIQLVAKANAQGLALTPQDVFEADSIAALAAACHRATAVETGERRSMLTPHQRALAFQAGGTEADPVPGRLLYGVEGDVDPAIAETALGALMRRHPALRLRIGHGPEGPVQWPGDGPDCYVPDIDLRSLPEAVRQNTIRSMLTDMAGELDLADGPVVKLALIKTDDASSLLAWVGAGAVIDDGSWPRLVRDFHRACSQLTATGAVEWDRPAGDFLDWADEAAARSRTVDGQLDDTPRPMHTLDGELLSELTAENVDRATQHAHRAHRLDAREVLLAALARAWDRAGDTEAPATIVAERTRRPSDATGHLLASAVGRFTELVSLPAGTGAGDCRDTASAVKSGYRAPAGELPSGPRVLVREGLHWTGDDPVSGAPWPDGHRSRSVDTLAEITPAMVDGTLRLRWWYAPEAEAVVRAVAAELPRRLAELTAHFEATSDSSVDASDFPLVDMDDEDLRQFIAGLGDQ